jgi:hypothetical protein
VVEVHPHQEKSKCYDRQKENYVGLWWSMRFCDRHKGNYVRLWWSMKVYESVLGSYGELWQSINFVVYYDGL